jgi:hypothetical protein
LFTPINVNNYDLEAGAWLWPESRSHFPVPGSAEVIKHTVQAPKPPFGPVTYDWAFQMTGLHGDLMISDWVPDVFYKNDHFSMNVTAASGLASLVVAGLQLQAGQNYVADLEYQPLVKTIGAVSYAESSKEWQGLCMLWADSGFRYGFDPQGLLPDRTSWSDDLVEHVTVSFKATVDLGIVLSCGLNLNRPLWEGDVLWLSYRVEPVDWPDGDMQRVLR